MATQLEPSALGAACGRAWRSVADTPVSTVFDVWRESKVFRQVAAAAMRPVAVSAAATCILVLHYQRPFCPIHTARQTRQDGVVCVLSGGGVN